MTHNICDETQTLTINDETAWEGFCQVVRIPIIIQGEVQVLFLYYLLFLLSQVH